MITLIHFFIFLQCILLFLITLHDWIHLPPLLDIRELEKHHSKKERLITSSIFFTVVFIPLMLTWQYQNHYSFWVLITLVVVYGLLTLGTIFSWWVPYFFGSSAAHKAAFSEYQNTHRLLPARGDNVIPNTFHILLHLFIWSCFAIALYLLIA